MFSQRRTLLSPVTVEAIELIETSIKIINCELLSHVFFAMPPIPAVTHILTHSVNLAFTGFKNECRAWVRFGFVISGSGFKMRPVYHSVKRQCEITGTPHAAVTPALFILGLLAFGNQQDFSNEKFYRSVYSMVETSGGKAPMFGQIPVDREVQHETPRNANAPSLGSSTTLRT